MSGGALALGMFGALCYAVSITEGYARDGVRAFWRIVGIVAWLAGALMAALG